MLTKKEPITLPEDKLNLLGNLIYYVPIGLSAAASDLLADFESGMEERGLYRHRIKYLAGRLFHELTRCASRACAMFPEYNLDHVTRAGNGFVRAIQTDLEREERAIALQIGRCLPTAFDPFPLAKVWNIEAVCYLSSQATMGVLAAFCKCVHEPFEKGRLRLLPATNVGRVHQLAVQLREAVSDLYAGVPMTHDIDPQSIETGMTVIVNRVADPDFIFTAMKVD